MVTTVLAAAAVFAGKLLYGWGASSLMIAVALGVIVRWLVGAPAKMRPGVQFVQKHLLRIAIVLLGAQLTFEQVGAAGGPVLVVIIAAVVLTFAFTCWAGRWLRTDPALTQLIAAGSSICGISAIVASNTVLKAPDEDVAYAIATATAFGSLSIFLYPLIAAGLSLDPMLYAVWVGSSLHEVAQVIAAGLIYGEEAGEFAVVVKLTRVLMLVPMVLMLGWIAGLGARSSKSDSGSLLDVLRSLPLPIFIAGFVGMIAINSMGLISTGPRAAMTAVSAFLFAMALVALGLETDLRKLMDRGPRPLMVGGLAWIFVSCSSLLGVYLL
jgi:uncharacterized integral membrane protein (TIGR00698 family)